MTPTVVRIQRNQDTDMTDYEPRINTRGHLALVDWDRAADRPEFEAAPQKRSAVDPLHRSRAQKLIDRGMVVWMASIILAVAASMAHL